ncbi:MAG: hypothetical protein IT445_00235 [Phycisphaeraceae bacterium]|nr:hypothetical protein [Phycisphaeraceae bacterium]
MRQLVKTDPRLTSVAAAWFTAADEWVSRSEQQIVDMMPPEGALYAYGSAGDPKTDQPWPRFGEDRQCDLAHPWMIRSPHTGDVYGIQKPGEEYYDPGDGWVRPSDGRRFYFKGIWNSFMARQAIGSLQSLAMAYALSGDERYADRCLFMLDLMADRIGDPDKRFAPADWPGENESMIAFFNYTGNQANTRVCIASYAFDLVAGDGRGRQPSRFRPNFTLEQLMRDRLLLICEPWKISDNDSLQNHVLSAYGASLITSMLFGDEKTIRRDAAATYAFLDNTVNRDGDYYETSGSYADTGRSYGGRMIMMLRNILWSDQGEPSLGHWRSLLPDRPAITDDPRWCALALQVLYEQNMYGRRLSYGDNHSDLEVGFSFSSSDLQSISQYATWIYFQTQDPTWKLLAQRAYWAAPARIHLFNEVGMADGAGVTWKQPPPLAPGVEPLNLMGDNSFLRPAKRLVLLRDGKDKAQRGVFMRGCANASHAHDDQMAIMLYARGMLANGEFGYRFWGVPAHKGFGVQAASHNEVVVNEGLPPNVRLAKDNITDATVQSFLPIGPMQLIEFSNPGRWKEAGVSQYQRSVALVHVDQENFYALDVFRVTGGKMHDYFWHGPHQAEDAPAEDFVLRGAEPNAVDNVWTLAALDNPQWRDASFDQPGHAWGERIVVGSSQIRAMDPGDPGDVKTLQWNPEPQNGYGFIYDIKQAPTQEPWQAQWRLHDNRSHMRLTMLNPDGQSLISARTATLEQNQTFRTVIARRRAPQTGELHSRYVAIAEVADPGKFSVIEARWVEPQIAGGNPQDVASLLIGLTDGRTDRVLAADSAQTSMTAEDFSVTGRYGFARLDQQGQVTDAALVSGTKLTLGAFSLQLPAAAWQGQVLAVKPDVRHNRIEVDAALPLQLAQTGSIVRIDSPPGRTTPYTSSEVLLLKAVESAEGAKTTQLDFGEQQLNDTHLQVKQVNADGTVELVWPNELCASREAGRFDGAQIVVRNDPTRTTTLVNFNANRLITVADPGKLHPGDELEVRVAQPGDRFAIPTYAVLRRTGAMQWELRSNHDVQLTLPTESDQQLIAVSAAGKQVLGRSENGAVQVVLLLKSFEQGGVKLQLE